MRTTCVLVAAMLTLSCDQESSAAPAPQFGSSFGQENPFNSPFGQPDPFGSPFGQPNPFGSPFGQPDPFGSPFGQPDPFGSPFDRQHPYGSPFDRPNLHIEIPEEPKPFDFPFIPDVLKDAFSKKPGRPCRLCSSGGIGFCCDF